MCLVNVNKKCGAAACSELALYHPECIPVEYCSCGADNAEKVCQSCGKPNYFEFGRKVSRKEVNNARTDFTSGKGE